ncbi:MAG: hypothetical protein H6Q48_2888 [Deltaproteobacteria bacterium]|nr:hypothetical protein [Deltaproteobacteria bacterium]
MEKDQIARMIQKRLGLEDKEFQPIKDSSKFQRLFDNLQTGSRYRLVAEIVESKGCHSAAVIPTR